MSDRKMAIGGAHEHCSMEQSGRGRGGDVGE